MLLTLGFVMPGGVRFEHLPYIAILTHPERLKQMQPWGKLIQEYFACQNEASDLNVGCLVSLWKRVFSE